MDHAAMNPAAPHHLPSFVTAPGQSDWLMTVMLVSVVSVGLVYLKLHALPEHMAHRTSKVQLQFVAVLALLALFTHNAVFWIAALLLALVELPNFSTPMNSIALSLEKLSGRDRGERPPSDWNDLLSDDAEVAGPRRLILPVRTLVLSGGHWCRRPPASCWRVSPATAPPGSGVTSALASPSPPSACPRPSPIWRSRGCRPRPGSMPRAS